MKGREGCFTYLDIKIIGGQDELEESPLVHLNDAIKYRVFFLTGPTLNLLSVGR